MVFWLIILTPLIFFWEALGVKFVTWSLENAGYVDHVATFSQSCWIAFALVVFGLPVIFGSSS